MAIKGGQMYTMSCSMYACSPRTRSGIMTVKMAMTPSIMASVRHSRVTASCLSSATMGCSCTRKRGLFTYKRVLNRVRKTHAAYFFTGAIVWFIRLPGKPAKKRSRDPGYRAEVAHRADIVCCENSFIGQFLFPDTDPAELVPDEPNFLFWTNHTDASLAGDTIKRCIRIRGFMVFYLGKWPDLPYNQSGFYRNIYQPNSPNLPHGYLFG